MKGRRRLDPEHTIELSLIAVFAVTVVVVLVLAVAVLLPQVREGLSGASATPMQAAFEPAENTPSPIAPGQTPSRKLSNTPAVTFTVTPMPTATNSPIHLSATPIPQVNLVNSTSYACDRPGWFPEKVGLREHAVFHYRGQTYLIAAQQPERHAFLVARSSNLCRWEELAPILTQARLDAWDGNAIRSPFVIEQDKTYHLLYTGVTWNGTERILWATSTNPADSASWQVQGEAFRPDHAEGDWRPGYEAICRSASLLKDGDLVYLYYTGRDVGGGILGVALAESVTGAWQDWGAVLPATSADYESPLAVIWQGRTYLFYHLSGQGTQYRIGESPLGPWSEPFNLAPGWAHEIWQVDGQWFTSFLTDYTITIFPLSWEMRDGLPHPTINTPSPFLQDIPIWSHSGQPASHEVVLFRHTFSLEQPLSQVEINLFADTRYEVWLDGIWLGRGPARFSYRLREYDVYTPGRLEPGKHTLAVFVQWAPNNRRSESVAPFLQGHILGLNTAGQEVIVRTNAGWKALLSPAWQESKALVHSWGLIGPVELLDLSRLDVDWNQSGFDDRDWPLAKAINPSAVNYQPYKALYLEGETTAGSLPTPDATEQSTSLELAGAVSGVIYRPRSIPPLVDVQIPVTVLDAGLLSPGFMMGELPPKTTMPYVLPFTVDKDTYFTIEAPGVVGPAISIQLDGEYINWQKADATRPDVYWARVRLYRGPHKLTFERISPTGLTFSVSNENVSFPSFPFSQGYHIGRRLLLGAPVSDFESFEVIQNEQLSVRFPAAPSYIVLDMGRTVHGRIQVNVDGPTGTVMDMGWDERLLPGTLRPLPFPGLRHSTWNQTDSWVLDGSRRTISTLDTRAGRYILIAVWGDQPVELNDIRVYEERYPLELRGSFQSSDPLLDYIWKVGVDTLYPNMNDAYTDTPWRERGQWWGDAYVAERVNRVSFGDSGLLRRGLLYMADSYQAGGAPGLAPNSSTSNMTDYMMLWVHNLAEYVQLTGDMAILGDTYPVLQKFMAQMAGYESTNTGLINFRQAHWWQYTYVEMYGYRNRYGQSTAVNAIYYGTLLKAAYLAKQAGDLYTADQWQQKAERVQTKTNELLFSSTQQRYLATYYQGYYEAPTVHAQAWPLAYGLTSTEMQDAVAQALYAMIAKDPQQANMGIYGMYWVLDGLGQSGHIAEGLELIKSYYGAMLASGATTWWERMGADEIWTQSLSHAWGGSPTWFLTTYVLGARQVGPMAWEVQPALTGVDAVSGIVPLLNGDVSITWQQKSCGQFHINLISPTGASGTLILPFRAADQTIHLNQVLIWQDGIPLSENIEIASAWILIRLTEGAYRIDLEQRCP